MKMRLQSVSPKFKFSPVRVAAWIKDWEEAADATFGAPQVSDDLVVVDIEDADDQITQTLREKVEETLEEADLTDDIAISFKD
ncbi:hypothetical protein G8O24_11175 [Bradyrhizobium sp. INPA01-394B]|uniref:DUF768 domain-containing protein n=1 Tax=Bradyrhizobium campsiandrae TaxID=1729892 RepID=A0ABR7U415_9BRAD|nr:hypothetical protein [Bradyrhizobium campsiandrae]MBC9877902.1 hypothetical protein [Bradyrhizobium campsiandrae]MBC9978246.1 hypothetical protein [Bradyrhizobium campsiandrae]